MRTVKRKRTTHPRIAVDPSKHNVRAIAEILKPLGVPSSLFNHEIYFSEGFSHREYSDHLNIFKNKRQNQVSETLSIGISNNFFTSIPSMSMSNWAEFLKFMHDNNHVSEKSPPPTETALLDLFYLQCEDYKSEVEAMKKKDEEKISELRREIIRLRVNRAAKIEKIKARFAPASEYVPLLKCDLDMECWRILKEKKEKEREEKKKDGENEKKALLLPDYPTTNMLNYAYSVYGGEVNNNHVKDFLSLDDTRCAKLGYYIQKRIDVIRGQGDMIKAEKLYTTMLATHPQIMPEILPRHEEKLSPMQEKDESGGDGE